MQFQKEFNLSGYSTNGEVESPIFVLSGSVPIRIVNVSGSLTLKNGTDNLLAMRVDEIYLTSGTIFVTQSKEIIQEESRSTTARRLHFNSSSFWEYSQAFETTTSFSTNKVELMLGKTLNPDPTSSVWVEITSGTFNSLGTSIASTYHISSSVISASENFSWREFNFSESVNIISGGIYHLFFRCNYTTDATNSVSWFFTGSDVMTNSFATLVSSESAVTTQSYDFTFRIWKIDEQNNDIISLQPDQQLNVSTYISTSVVSASENNTYQQFDFKNKTSLQSGSAYFLYLKGNYPTGSECVLWYYQSTGSYNHGNSYIVSDTETFSSISLEDQAFKIYRSSNDVLYVKESGNGNIGWVAK